GGIEQVCKIEPRPPRPAAVRSRRNDRLVLEQDLDIEIAAKRIILVGCREPRQDDIQLSRMQLWEFERWCRHGFDAQRNVRVIATKFLHHWRQDRARERIWTADLDVSLGRISEKLNVADALL